MQVHDTVVSDMTNKAMQGYNGTLLAYGQTGAGKTYTITGTTENYKHRGVIPRAIAEVINIDKHHIFFCVYYKHLTFQNHTLLSNSEIISVWFSNTTT